MLNDSIGPPRKSYSASMVCWAATFQSARLRPIPSLSQRSCPGPVMVCLSLRARAQRSLKPSPHGWSVRYWRVSSTLNWARSP
jgi:hypothetical protein